jgi:hypothetical protein
VPDKDTATWISVGGGLAAAGSWIRYYMANKHKRMTLGWWLDGAVDLIASVTIGIIVFLITSHFVGDIAAAGFAGFSGHIGARETVLMLRKFTGKR